MDWCNSPVKPNYKQRVIDFFNSRTAYDAEGDEHPNEAKRLLDYIPLASGQSVLDIATGTGLLAIPAAQAILPSGMAIGVDISPIMLAQAREKIVKEAVDNLELIEADIELSDFAPKQFDVIFCCSAIVYITDIPAILAKCYRWLKPQGYFTFSTPDRSSHLANLKVQLCRELFDIDLPHIIRPLWTPEKCRSLLQQSGFHSIEIQRHQYSRSRINKNTKPARIENDFYPRGNPLQNLSKKQLKQLQSEYTKAVNQLVEKQGIWQEANNLYVKARK